MDFPAITRRQLYVAMIVVVLLIGAIIIERVVVTDQERIEGTIRSLRDAVGDADVDALFDAISEDYSDDVLAKEGLRSLAEVYFNRYGRTRVRILSMTINWSGDLAAVELRVLATPERGAGRLGRCTWLLLVHKDPDNVWRVIRIEPLSWDGRDIDGWSALRHLGGI